MTAFFTWHRRFSAVDQKHVIYDADRTIATVYRADDARLIAAAPEMLAALRILAEAVGSSPEALQMARHQYDDALKVIAEATGEQP